VADTCHHSKSQCCVAQYPAYPLPGLTEIEPAAAASKHITAPINHTRPSPHKHSPDGATPSEVVDNGDPITTYSFLDVERMKGSVGLVG